MSLALSTLFYEWRRYLGAVIALALAGLLVLAEVGFFMGIGKSVTESITSSPAEIMILSKQSESLMGNTAGLPRRIQPLLYMNPNVLAVAEMSGSGVQFQNIPGPGQKRKEDGVQLRGIDPFPGSITMPTNFTEAQRLALLEPFAVAIDRSSLKKLGVKLGDRAIINGRTVKVAVVLDGPGELFNTTVTTSRQSLRLITGRVGGPRSGPLFVRVRDPAKTLEVRDQLNAASNGAYRAWTREELGKANENAMWSEGGIGIMLGFSVFIGLVIGIAITSQTMRGAIMANIKEFASLRALGVGMGPLRLSTLELSFWVGIAGLGMTGLLVYGTALLAENFGVTMSFPLPAVIIVGAFLVIISLISGVVALGALKKSQPADLLR